MSELEYTVEQVSVLKIPDSIDGDAFYFSLKVGGWTVRSKPMEKEHVENLIDGLQQLLRISDDL